MIAHVLFAQAYGQGAYSCGQYSSGCQSATNVIRIGPAVLPATGATLLAIISAALIALGVGLYVWARQRRKRVAG